MATDLGTKGAKFKKKTIESALKNMGSTESKKSFKTKNVLIPIIVYTAFNYFQNFCLATVSLK